MVEGTRLASYQGRSFFISGETLAQLVIDDLQGVASFHLDKLTPDLHFNDSTLVVNPCNSPEQVPITFGMQYHIPMLPIYMDPDRSTGCAHSQQLIWQLFNAVEKGFTASGDTDIAFLEGAGIRLSICCSNVDILSVCARGTS